VSRFPFPSVPDGWFSVAASSEVTEGEIVTRSLLERELVAFRSPDGAARVFDAHCPHLGAHLGVGGRLCDDGIVCPFHGWRFDGNGELREVPFVDGQPPHIAARTYPTCEVNDRLFVWVHAGGAAPSYELKAYRTDGDWTPWRADTYRVRTHVQELSENIIDRSHFFEVHDMLPPDDARFDVVFEDHTMVVDQNIKVTALAPEGIEVQTKTTVCGPGVAAIEVREGELDMLTYITQTPIDDEHTEVTIHFSMRALEDATASAEIAELNAKITNLQFTQDVAIWENKVYRAHPPVTKADGPLRRYRRWFAQFYSGAEGPGQTPVQS